MNEILQSKTSQLRKSTSSDGRNCAETKGEGLFLENSINTSTNNVQYICCSCKNISKDNINFQNVSYAESKNLFQCNVCEYVGLSSDGLKKHMNIHIERNCFSNKTEKVVIAKKMESKNVQCSQEIISDDVKHLNMNTTVRLSKNNAEVLNVLQKVKSSQINLLDQINTTVSDRDENCKVNNVHKLDVYNNCEVKLYRSKMNNLLNSNRSEHSKFNESHKGSCILEYVTKVNKGKLVDNTLSTTKSWKEIDKKLKLYPVVVLDNISIDVHKYENKHSLKNKYTNKWSQTEKICMKSIKFGIQNQKWNNETYKIIVEDMVNVELEKKSRIDQELNVTGEGRSGHKKKLFKDIIWSEKKKTLEGINGVCDLEEYNKQKLSISNLKKYKCNLCLFVSASRQCVKDHSKVHYKSSAKKIVKNTSDKTSVHDNSISNVVKKIGKHTKKIKQMDKDEHQCNIDVLGTNDISNVVKSMDKTHNKVNFDKYKIPKLSRSGKKPLHKCLLCNFKSASHETLIQHGRVHNRTKITGLKDIVENSDEKCNKKIKINKLGGNESKYKCRKCDLRFQSAASYDDHRRNHIKQTVYKCGKCDYSCKTISSLRFHQYTHSGEKPYKCKLCPYSCRRPENILPHMRAHLGEKPHKCTYCGDSFTQACSLKTHMRTHTGERPYKCEECDYKCARLSNLKTHMDKHSGIKPYKCILCDYACSRSATLKVHSRTHTGERPYKCTLCNYSASIPACLNQHMYVHTREKPLKCTMCPYGTVSSEALAIHIRSHTGEKPYKCKHCDFRTSRNSSLIMHNRIHTGEKPYVCSICRFSSARLGNLKVHIRSHTGDKPYSCNTCPTKFTTKSSLIIHNRIHTGERPYKCMTCGYGFVASAEMKKHIKRTHEKHLYMKEAPTKKTEDVGKN